MKYKMWSRIVFVLLVAGVPGCHGETSPPTAPTARPLPTPPAGGMFIKGTVSDTAYRALAGARVEVLDGPQAGSSATADARGEFSMSGTFDETTRFRATAEGHVTATRTLQPFCERCNPNWWINFTLGLPDSPVDIGGDYTLTIVANNTCTMLPDDVRSRSYTTTIPKMPATPTGFAVDGPTFLDDWNVIGLGVAGDYVAMWFETLVEQIAPSTFLSFGGQAAATVDPSNLSTFVLPFHGTIAYCVTSADNGEYDCRQDRATIRECNSHHQLTFTRR